MEHLAGMIMRAAALLDLPDIAFVEPSFESLIDDSYSLSLLSSDAEESILLVDEEEWPMAFGISQNGDWRFTNYTLRRPPREVLDIFERRGGRIFQESWEIWMEAVREYYSLMISRDHSPAINDFSEERLEKLHSLIEHVWGRTEGAGCIDAGCGSGAGSIALRHLGYDTLSYDNDPSLLSLGLTSGRLDPGRTICIDGSAASRYLSPEPFGVAFMAGTIDHTNAWMWERIIDQLLFLTESTLITVGMKEETRFIEKWSEGEGRELEIFENDRDPFYDRWVCVISKD